ncbi:MAG: hypothetical protein ACLSCQ_06240 [Evtepia gabavorous]
MAYGSVKMCLQCATCSMVSTCLFRALKFLSCRDSRVKEEACRWPQGKTLRLEIPGARGFTVTGTEKGFRKLPQDTPGDVTIRFKSPDDAFRVFTGQIGIAQAYAQHRFTLRETWAWPCPLCDVWTLRRGIFSPRFWPGES